MDILAFVKALSKSVVENFNGIYGRNRDHMAGTETTVAQMHKMDGYSSKKKKKHKMVHPKIKFFKLPSNLRLSLIPMIELSM